MFLPKDILKLIHEFAAYFPEPWIPVAEHKNYNYGWVPQVEMVEDLVTLPGC